MTGGPTSAGPMSGGPISGDEAPELLADGERWEDVRARVTFDAKGLVPAIIQQWDTGEVLMLGWMDAEALHRTLTEGRVTFWSRSRQSYWRKGDTSGHGQYVKSLALDCDGDTLLVRVDQVGVACHTGTRTCFDGDPVGVVVGDRPGEA